MDEIGVGVRRLQLLAYRREFDIETEFRHVRALHDKLLKLRRPAHAERSRNDRVGASTARIRSFFKTKARPVPTTPEPSGSFVIADHQAIQDRRYSEWMVRYRAWKGVPGEGEIWAANDRVWERVRADWETLASPEQKMREHADTNAPLLC